MLAGFKNKFLLVGGLVNEAQMLVDVTIYIKSTKLGFANGSRTNNSKKAGVVPSVGKRHLQKCCKDE